jgi:hypothetical protein
MQRVQNNKPTTTSTDILWKLQAVEIVASFYFYLPWICFNLGMYIPKYLCVWTKLT